MKKTLRIVLATSMALSLIACNKEVENLESSDGREITLSFRSEKPSLTDAETRTAWNGSTINWSKGDNVRIAYTVNGAWQGAAGAANPKLYASTPLTDDTAIADFAVSASFTDTDNEGLVDPEYKFYGVYPSSLVSGTDFTPTTITFTLPSDQTPAASSFASGVDVMYATSDAYEGIPSDRKVDLTWHRVVSHADISMRNIMVEEGETLESITVTAQTGADLTGQHTLDITDGTIALPEGKTGLNFVTVNADNLAFSDGAVEFWFTTLPFTATELTFTVKTNKYTYVRTFTGIDLEFLGNARNTLSVNMKKAQKFQDYTEDFTSGIGEFTTSGTDGIWNVGSYNGTYYMKGTSYINKTNTDGEGWLLSPYLSINSSDSELSFDQSINAYFKNSSNESTLSNEATVWARERGGAWQQITIAFPTEPSSGFTDFEPTSASLSSFNGKTIQIGFKYIGYASSANGGCGTWEIANFKVSNSEVVYYPSFEFTSATTANVSFGATTVEFAYSAAHLTSEPTIAIKAGSDDIIDGTPTISNGKVTASIKANTETTAKKATLVVTCEGVTDIPELVINQEAKSDLVETEATIDFTAQGYSNGEVVNSLTQDPFTVTITKGGTNDPKYYTSDNTLRFYTGGSMTVSSEYTITKIVLTGTVAATVGGNAVSNKTWTGSSKSVEFVATGTNKISKLTITYLAPGSTIPSTPVITLSNLPTSNIAAAGDVVTINYSIENPVTGVSVSASAGSNTWVNTFDYSVAGAISFVVDEKTTSGTRTATITVSYPGAENKTFNITQDGASSTGDHGQVTITAAALTNGVLSDQGFTLTFAKNNGSTEPTYNSNGSDLRLYAKGTVVVDGGTKTITGIVFNLSAQGKKRLAPITADNGTVATQASGDETVSWSGSNSSVTFTVGDNADYGSDGSTKAGQLCFSSVTITY